MPTKKNLTIRVPKDTYEKFEKYRGDDLSKADAGRRLLESGLENEQSDAAGVPSAIVMLGLIIGGGLISALFVGWYSMLADLITRGTYFTTAVVVLGYNLLFTLAYHRGLLK